MRKKKLQLVPDKGKPEISNLSPEEEARVLNLADIALHNPTATNNLCVTDSGARADLRRTMEGLQREAEKIRRPKRVA